MTSTSSARSVVEVGAPGSAAGGAAPPNGKERGLKVLVADKFEQSGIDALDHAGCAVTARTDVTPDALAAAVRELDPDVLIVRGKKVPASVFETGGKLSLVVRAGAGFDTIDVAAASAKGVFVANCPGKNAIAVAELAWGLILSCDRRIPDQVAELRAGAWNKKTYSEAEGLHGRTLGVVGVGQIGQEIAKRGKAFGMRVVAWSRHLTQERADELGVGFCSKLLNLAKMADVVSVNVAGNEETRHLINPQFFDAMKIGSIFINTSRGSVVDEDALAKAAREKKIRAGLDVFEQEPGGGTGEFKAAVVQAPGVYGTHHVGASTNQAQQAIAAETVRIITHYLRTGNVLNCVNRAARTAATCLLTVRHLNRPGVLAHVFYTLGQASINVEEMENIIYEGEQAACARVQLSTAPSLDHLNAIRANANVISVSLTSIAR